MKPGVTLKSVLSAAFVLTISFACTLPLPEDDRGNRIQHVLDSLVTTHELPGLNLSILPSNGIQENYSSGYANLETRTAMNSDFVLFSGSIGKTYAVAILMQLVDEGKLVLNDPFIDHFPDVEWLWNLPNIDAITVKMLLQHTSGLPRYVMKPEIWSMLKENPDKVWTCKERMSYIFNDEPVHEAGKGWSYSDSGYILLGMLIEKITGKPYYDVVNGRILTKLNLNDTHPSIKREMFNLAQGYSRLPDFFHIPENVVSDGKYCFNPQLEWTGGGFASTTPDLARWAEAYYKGKLFSDSLLAKIITPNDQAYLIQPGLSYGTGSFIFDTGHGKAYAHSGFVPGFLSMFAHYPDSRISAALQINCDYATESLNLIDMLNLVLTYKVPAEH